MPIHETPWYRAEASDGRPALRNRVGIVCKFTRPHHYEGQDERFRQEMEEVEDTIKLVKSAPALRDALEIIAAGNTDPDDMICIAINALSTIH
jgi:hypothetical protein